jgi:hypothetical protein
MEPTLGRNSAVVAMEGLSVDDQIMLWPHAIWPQEDGALAVLGAASLFGLDGRCLPAVP